MSANDVTWMILTGVLWILAPVAWYPIFRGLIWCNAYAMTLRSQDQWAGRYRLRLMVLGAVVISLFLGVAAVVLEVPIYLLALSKWSVFFTGDQIFFWGNTYALLGATICGILVYLTRTRRVSA